MSRRKKIILGFVSMLTSLSLFGAGCALQAPQTNKNNGPVTTLTYWSVFNESNQMAAIIDAYKAVAPNVSITYKKLEIGEYEKQLIDALAQNRGPDIFSVHSAWMPKYLDKLEPIPQSAASLDQFVPVVSSVVAKDNQVYGLPYSVDTLSLYYNPKMLNSAGVASAPATWDEFDEAVKKLAAVDASKNITRAAAAIGTADNVNRGIDPLELLMLQNGTEMTNATNTEATFAHKQMQNEQQYSPGLAAFNKFLSYSRPTSATYTWNNSFSSAFDELSRGRLAMLFNYNYNYDKILALNSQAGIRVAAAPQIAGTKNPVALASFWVEGVAQKSQQKTEAWKFLLFATGKEGAKIYAEQTHKPGARMDVLNQQQGDRTLAAFVTQAPIATTWYQKSVGPTESALAEMINSVLTGKLTSENALIRGETAVSVIMKNSQ